MIQAAPESRDEIVEVEHSDEGTKLRIEDPTPYEVVAIALIVTAVLGFLFSRYLRRNEERYRRGPF